MGHNLLAENWTVTGAPCSFWLIKEILIYCHGNGSVSRANRRRRRGCGDRHTAGGAGIRSEAARAGEALPSALGTRQVPLGQCLLASRDPKIPATWSSAPFVGFWG